jgi:hypothetical protein
MAVLVEALLQRGSSTDLREARAARERVAAARRATRDLCWRKLAAADERAAGSVPRATRPSTRCEILRGCPLTGRLLPPGS